MWSTRNEDLAVRAVRAGPNVGRTPSLEDEKVSEMKRRTRETLADLQKQVDELRTQVADREVAVLRLRTLEREQLPDRVAGLEALLLEVRRVLAE